MAKIEMDLSEFKIMEENKVLLEKALAKEEALNKEIIRLKEEKIKILKDNDKVVTIVEVKNTVETKSTYLDIHEISRRIQQQVNPYNENNPQRLSSKNELYNLFDTFFQTHTHELENNRTITRKGLDEVTTEIRKELESEISISTKNKLEKLNELNTEKGSWYKDNDLLKKDLKALNKENSSLSKEVSELAKELKGKIPINHVISMIERTNVGLLKSKSTLKKVLISYFKNLKNE